MFSIDPALCTGCGLCLGDCPAHCITLQSGRAQIGPKGCIGCGHCVAVCPAGAAHMQGAPTAQLPACGAGAPAVPPQSLLSLMRCRRSVRQYLPQPPSPATLQSVLAAADASPRGSNRASLRLILVTEALQQLRLAALQALRQRALDAAPGALAKFYARRFTTMHDDYVQNGVDRLFFHAPAVVLVVGLMDIGTTRLDGGLAASCMELMAASLGLGACHIGFFNMAAEAPSVKQLLGLAPREFVIDTLTLGLPAVHYRRAAPRPPLPRTLL